MKRVKRFFIDLKDMNINFQDAGPWRVDERHGAVYGVIADEGTVTVHNHGSTSISDYVAQPGHGHAADPGSNGHANMRLIAAAPELLRVVRMALEASQVDLTQPMNLILLNIQMANIAALAKLAIAKTEST